MDIFYQFLKAFLVGGVLCGIGQILIDKTKLTPARILTLYVVTGVLLGAAGVYKPLVKWAGAGATVPLTGFGYALSEGVRRGVAERGVVGAFTGGFTAAAGGLAAAVVFGALFALLGKPADRTS
ncbi:MAG: SpoVA/SpoVAEb family sporulation membrane protein [Oscillospiraceae bacterium]|jgi:stage V sporulation protein AE|nr:SpoVA/SpoVAEb family sporulation membrane protein [Oscillospiraceae bacterium]